MLELDILEVEEATGQTVSRESLWLDDVLKTCVTTIEHLTPKGRYKASIIRSVFRKALMFAFLKALTPHDSTTPLKKWSQARRYLSKLIITAHTMNFDAGLPAAEDTEKVLDILHGNPDNKSSVTVRAATGKDKLKMRLSDMLSDPVFVTGLVPFIKDMKEMRLRPMNFHANFQAIRL